jgi:hypothetical protein
MTKYLIRLLSFSGGKATSGWSTATVTNGSFAAEISAFLATWFRAYP